MDSKEDFILGDIPFSLTPIDYVGEGEFVDVPSWFLENCVKTRLELQSLEIPLIVKELSNAGESPNVGIGLPDERPSFFEIESVVYDALAEEVLLRSEDTTKSQSWTKKPRFSKEYVELQVPSLRVPCPYSFSSYRESAAAAAAAAAADNKGGVRFLQSVVEHFARESGGHLVTMRLEDVEDFAQNQFRAQEGVGLPASECLDLYFLKSGDNTTEVVTTPTEEGKGEGKGSKASDVS